MATKGFQKFTNKIFGGKSESPQTEMRKEQVVIANNRKRAGEMISKLRCINLYDKKNQIPQEVIAEEEFQTVINWAMNELNEPTVFTMDISSLDDKIDFAIDAFSKAIKEGWVNTARWAATALHQGLSNLRQDISGIDVPNADALYEKRLNYAIEMENIVKASQDYDVAEIALKKQNERYQNKNNQAQKLKEELNNLKNTIEGAQLEEEIRQNAHKPGALSKEARDLKQKYEEYHKLIGSMQEIYLEIMAKTAVLNDCDRKIETIRNHLVETPVVNDPMLNARIERANNIHIREMQKTLDDIEISKRTYDQYLSKMKQLSNHKVFQDEAANVIATMQKIENEEREKLDRSIRNAQMIKAKLQKNAEKQKELAGLKEEINNLHLENEKLYQENTLQEDDYETDYEDEEEYNENVEYEYEPE